MATSPTYPSGVAGITKTIVNADANNWVLLYNNSTSNSAVRVEALNLCSDDTASVNVQIGIQTSGINFLLGTVRVPTLSGTDGAAAIVNGINVVGSISPDAIRVVYVPASANLVARSTANVTVDRTVTMTGWTRLYT